MMPESVSRLQIAERRANGVTILVLTGEILLDDGDLAFRKKVHEILDRGDLNILVDLAGVTYIDSSGVGMIVAKLKTVTDKGGRMKLLHLTRRSQRLLALMKLSLVFETFDDEALGVRSFSWNAGK
jgi:anti-sigma B factor antagonist